MPVLQQKPWSHPSGPAMTLIEFYEKHLGPIERGWESATGPEAVQVCLFQNQPISGVFTLATLGLSAHELKMSGGRSVRQEFILAAQQQHRPGNLAKLLLDLSEKLLREHLAVLRGQVVPLGAPVAHGSEASALYASVPVVYPPGIAKFNETSPATVIVWLFPVLPQEATYIATMGWNVFEELLEQADPNLFDLNRPCVFEE